MKTKLIHFIMAVNVVCYGQSFSDKTNAIKLNYNSPITATTLPTIVWTIPRAERSNSTDPTITFEASITSDVPLKEFFWKNLNSLRMRGASWELTPTNTPIG